MTVQTRGFNHLSLLRKSLLASSFIFVFSYFYSTGVISQETDIRIEENAPRKVLPFMFDNKPWYLVGRTTFSWGFWDIYDSALFTPTGQFLVTQYQADTLSLLLLITYQKNFSAKTLLDATVEQWEHLGVGELQINEWEKRMQGSWPAISKGDKLYYLYNGVKGQFFYQKQEEKPYLYSEIKDKTQAKAFIAIWLSPRTAYPKQRAALIGQ